MNWSAKGEVIERKDFNRRLGHGGVNPQRSALFLPPVLSSFGKSFLRPPDGGGGDHSILLDDSAPHD